jgi:hypothetical protein
MASRAMKIDSKKSVTSDPNAVGVTTNPDSAIQSGDTASLDQSELAARSYELWQERGCPVGSPEFDWFRAEAELRNRQGSIRTAA